jgi:hypothetical protein
MIRILWLTAIYAAGLSIIALGIWRAFLGVTIADVLARAGLVRRDGQWLAIRTFAGGVGLILAGLALVVVASCSVGRFR